MANLSSSTKLNVHTLHLYVSMFFLPDLDSPCCQAKYSLIYITHINSPNFMSAKCTTYVYDMLIFVEFVCTYVYVCVCMYMRVHQWHSTQTHWHDIHAIHYPLQVKLLQSLGLRSTLITDGSKPVNLFNIAQGLLVAIGSGPSNPEEED